jgi:membrane protein DedA with SNARE-associated domain
VQQFISQYTYLAVFVLMLAESACIPIPSELTMLLGGALAGGAVAGAHPALALVIIVGVIGNVVGSYVAWAVGKYAGQAVVHRWGRYLLVTQKDLDKAQVWFDRRGAASVLVGRLLPVIRTFISLPAGIAGMRPVRFGVLTLIGCIPWTAGLGIAGYYVGAAYQKVADDFKGPTYVIAAIVVVLVVIGAVVFIKRRRAEIAEELAEQTTRIPRVR